MKFSFVISDHVFILSYLHFQEVCSKMSHRKHAMLVNENIHFRHVFQMSDVTQAFIIICLI